MYYSAIRNFDVANGEGIRVTIFVSGCRNHCKGCFQPETWDFKYGQEYTKDTEGEILKLVSNEHIKGLTLLGGDPFEPENQKDLAELTSILKERYPEKNIWAYTGYLVEDLVNGTKNKTDYTEELLNNIDTLVDGPFVLEKKNLRLRFRGSENQRILQKDEKGIWKQID